MNKRTIKVERLKEMLTYCPESGIFTRNVDVFGGQYKSMLKAKAGDVAGCRRKDGYIVISIDGTVFLAHRLAWLYMHGAFPEKLIDHIDGDKSNNRIANLRSADYSINGLNVKQARSHNTTSGVLGVRKTTSKSKSPRWQAMIKFEGRQRYLGNYSTIEEAQAAYIEAKGKAIARFEQPSSQQAGSEESNAPDSSQPA